MQANGFSELAPPPAGATVHEAMFGVYRHLIGPWERHPRMLEAYFRARNLPGGHRLDDLGAEALGQVTAELWRGRDRAYARDFDTIMRSVTYAAIGQCANGELDITDVLPLIERTLRRLTTDNARHAQPLAPVEAAP
jgi:hypothetical protein